MPFSLTPQTPPEGAADPIPPLLVWQAVRKHWPLVLAAMAVTVAATIFYLAGKPIIYRSTATVLIDPMPPSPLGKGMQQVGDPFGWYWSEVHLCSQYTSIFLFARRTVSLFLKD